MTVEELKKRKQRMGFTNEDLSELSGVPLGTVQKIMSGATRVPRRETLLALEKVLNPTGYPVQESMPVFSKPSAIYQAKKKQGEYTLDDYLALPDERRVELIDGVFYDMSAPTLIHQQLIVNISNQLFNQMDKCPHDCVLSLAPTDVQLDKDQKTIVQPDILIVCDKEKIAVPRVCGAPDFIIEILSPSTMRKDFMIKGRKYQAAGVREYWLVDPDTRQIVQFDFSRDAPVRFYSFDQRVPVLISEGKSVVDFAVISERLAPFYEGE